MSDAVCRHQRLPPCPQCAASRQASEAISRASGKLPEDLSGAPIARTVCLYLSSQVVRTDPDTTCWQCQWHECEAGLGVSGEARIKYECQVCPPAQEGRPGYEPAYNPGGT